MASPVVRVRRWSRREYERLIDLGVFRRDERLELLDGALVVREPQNAPHAASLRAVAEALRLAFGPGWDVRTQMPIALDDSSEPEPDVAVVAGSYRDYQRAHPSRPVLVVEVSDATLASDRRKRGVYARAGVEEFWIVNLRERVLEVYRRPTRAPGSRFGWTYDEVRVLSAGESIAPLAAPDGFVLVDDLFPGGQP
jgi:Uma2 family endonuclease